MGVVSNVWACDVSRRFQSRKPKKQAKKSAGGSLKKRSGSAAKCYT